MYFFYSGPNPTHHHHRQVRIAREGRRVVAPPCPRSTARLQRSPVGRVESFRSWSSHLFRGRPGGRRNPTHQQLKNLDPTQPVGQLNPWTTLIYTPSVLFLAVLDPMVGHTMDVLSLFSRPRSEGWPHHGRTFTIYLCPLNFAFAGICTFKRVRSF